MSNVRAGHGRGDTGTVHRVQPRDITADEAMDLLGRQESHFWDFKSARSKGAAIQKVACAFANADGGEFALGIEDARAATGFDRWAGYSSIEACNYVLEALARDVVPAVPYSMDFLSITGQPERGYVCVVTVRKSESVHKTAEERVWLRRNAATVEIKGQDIVNLSLSKGARSYEDQVVQDYDADEAAGEEEIKKFLAGLSPATTADEFLRKQRLIDRATGNARVAAAILFADSPPAVVPKRCAIKVARYETKVAEPHRQHLAGTPLTLEGPAKPLIDQALTTVATMIESVSALQPNGEMAPLRYPPDALKEVVVNAVIHRDYNVSDDILIHVFDNRVEVRSPGLLPGHMTLDNLLTDRFSRNPTIVRLLNKYPDPPNKDIGEGLNTAVRSMADAKLQAPEFQIEGNYFVATIGHTPLARPEVIVMEYLGSHDEITNAIGRELTGITSENSMKDVFYALRETGQLEMVPGKRGRSSAWRKPRPGDQGSTGADDVVTPGA